MSTPRYILQTSLVSDAPKYEFHLQAMSKTKPSATLVVESEQTFLLVLLNAVEWAQRYSEKQHEPVYPKVRYGDSMRMVKKIVGSHAWVENQSHGAWVPVGALTL